MNQIKFKNKNNKSLKDILEFIKENIDWSYSLDIESDDKIFTEYPSGYPVWISKELEFIVMSFEEYIQEQYNFVDLMKNFICSN